MDEQSDLKENKWITEYNVWHKLINDYTVKRHVNIDKMFHLWMEIYDSIFIIRQYSELHLIKYMNFSTGKILFDLLMNTVSLLRTWKLFSSVTWGGAIYSSIIKKTLKVTWVSWAFSNICTEQRRVFVIGMIVQTPECRDSGTVTRQC